MSKDLHNAIKERRSIYGLDKNVSVSDEKIMELVNNAVLYTPSAFNSQSARVVVLLGNHHDRLWDITKEALRKLVPEGNFAQTEDKINSFKNAYGTVLYFEDQSVIEGLQAQFELYKDNFPVWSQQSSGMLQYVVWTSLDAEGLGASLQHYNPLIDEDVKREWSIPSNWKLIGEMPFGNIIAPAGEKQFNLLEGRVKIFK